MKEEELKIVFEAGYRYYRERIAEMKYPYDEVAKGSMSKGWEEYKKGGKEFVGFIEQEQNANGNS